MEWVRSHPYACSLAAAAVLVIVGIVVIKTHSSLATPSGLSAWSGGSGALVSGASAGSTATAPAQTQPSPSVNNSTIDTGTLPYTPPPQNPLAQSSQSSPQLSALLAELSHPSGSPSAGGSTNVQTSASTSTVASAYAFIPSGTIAVQNASQEQYTVAQQELYTYGNEAGTYIQTYEQKDADQTQVLTDSIQSRGDSTKAAAVSQVGSDLIEVGKQLLNIPNVPTQAQFDNSQLAASYEASGKDLQAVAVATNGSDSNLIAAIQAYDTTAGTLVSRYATLALLFSANSVVFGTDDPGSVFSFNQAGSL